MKTGRPALYTWRACLWGGRLVRDAVPSVACESKMAACHSGQGGRGLEPGAPLRVTAVEHNVLLLVRVVLVEVADVLFV